MMITDNLLRFERKPDEAIFMNGEMGRYLHVASGAAKMNRILYEIREDIHSIVENPQYSDVVQMLKNHYIIVNETHNTVAPTCDIQSNGKTYIAYVECKDDIDCDLCLTVIQHKFYDLLKKDRLLVYFYGTALESRWADIQNLIKNLINIDIEHLNARIGVKIECDLTKMPNRFDDFIKDYNIDIMVSYPSQGELIQQAGRQLDRRVEGLAHISGEMVLTTEVTPENVDSLCDIARHFVSINPAGGYHFSPMNPVQKSGQFSTDDTLVQPCMYANKIKDIFSLKLIPNDLFITTRDLCIRFMRVRQYTSVASIAEVPKSHPKSHDSCFLNEVTQDNNIVRAVYTKKVNSGILRLHNLCKTKEDECCHCTIRYICGGMEPFYRRLSVMNEYSEKTITYFQACYCELRKQLLSSIAWDVIDEGE